MAIDFVDNSKAVKEQMAQNMKKALAAMGEEGVGMVIDTMTHGYYRDIHRTGQLKRDIKYRTDSEGQRLGAVSWGVLVGDISAPYAAYVHEGTERMEARPFLQDGILKNKEALREVAETHLKSL